MNRELVMAHDFREGLGPFRAWSGDEVDASHVETGPFGLRLHVAETSEGWKGAAVVLPEPFTYGRVAIRCRLPRGKFKGIALLWPEGPWPPEIDFLEIGAMWSARGRNNQTLHYSDDAGAHQLIQTHYAEDMAAWHRVACAWRPGEILHLCDGQVKARVTDPHVPDVPMKLQLKSNPGDLSEHEAGAFEVRRVYLYREAS